MTYTRAQSQQLFERAQASLAGGAGSGVRLSEQPGPLYFARGNGARITDVDGNEYIDYILGQGPLLLGHNPPEVLQAVRAQLDSLIISAGQHQLEIELSERLQRVVPCCEMVRYNNSGSEVVAAALRLARAHTGRQKFIKFEGHYHGWLDGEIISYWPDLKDAGPREAPRAVPGSGGMAQSVLDEVIVLPWNDLALVEQTLAAHGHEIAALITEPIMVNTGGCQPRPGFLAGLRELCTRYGVVLIFDEVITGFRVALGGAQELYGVTPDLATFAKGIAAGFPLSAIAGKREIMDLITRGVVLHGGTYNTHPMVMAAANATVKHLECNRTQIYSHLFAMGERLRGGLMEMCERKGVPVLLGGVGPVVQMAFTQRDAFNDYRDYLERDVVLYRRFVAAMAERGVRTILRGTWYISAAHSEADIEETLDCAEAALATL
ncbi:MAG: aspartate aminotransferase family protein [Chloroflexota bacterium]